MAGQHLQLFTKIFAVLKQYLQQKPKNVHGFSNCHGPKNIHRINNTFKRHRKYPLVLKSFTGLKQYFAGFKK